MTTTFDPGWCDSGLDERDVRELLEAAEIECERVYRIWREDDGWPGTGEAIFVTKRGTAMTLRIGLEGEATIERGW